GAKGDGDGAGAGTDDTQAWRDVFNVGLGNSTIWGRPVVYNILSATAAENLFNCQTRRISGANWWRQNQGGTILYFGGANTANKCFYSQNNRCWIENVIVLGNNKLNYGVWLNTAHGSNLRNVGVQGTLLAGVLADG